MPGTGELGLERRVVQRRQVGVVAGVGVEAEAPGAQREDLFAIHQRIGVAVRIVLLAPCVALADEPADQEYRRRPAEPVQHRARVVVHAAEPVVEGEQERALRQGGATVQPGEEVVDGHRLPPGARKRIHVCSEGFRAHAVFALPVVVRGADAVVHQDRDALGGGCHGLAQRGLGGGLEGRPRWSSIRSRASGCDELVEFQAEWGARRQCLFDLVCFDRCAARSMQFGPFDVAQHVVAHTQTVIVHQDRMKKNSSGINARRAYRVHSGCVLTKSSMRASARRFMLSIWRPP